MSTTANMDIADAAEKGTHLQLLKAMRTTIAKEISEGVPARDLASLSRRLQDIAEKIDSIEARNQKDARESNPCPKCNGTGVGSGRSRAAASSNDDWRPE